MSLTPTFATAPGFLGITRSDPGADFVVAGVPLDIGTTNRAGARDGPHAIRRASRMLTDGEHPEFWIEPATMNLADIGDLQLALGDIPASLRLIEQQVAGLAHLVALGGEHGITLPLLRALSRRVGGALALVHFDAHVDTWPTNFGQTHAHGSVFYHAIEERLVEPQRMIQIGIRSPVEREVWDWTIGHGVTVLTAQDVHAMGPACGRAADPRRGRRGTGLSQLRRGRVGSGIRSRHRYTGDRRAWRPGRCRRSCAGCVASRSPAWTSWRLRRPTMSRRSPRSRLPRWRGSILPWLVQRLPRRTGQRGTFRGRADLCRQRLPYR